MNDFETLRTAFLAVDRRDLFLDYNILSDDLGRTLIQEHEKLRVRLIVENDPELAEWLKVEWADLEYSRDLSSARAELVRHTRQRLLGEY